MAVETPCQTDGAQFETRIQPDKIRLTVYYGRELNLTEDEAKLLEANLHNAVELVLARYWK